jgi:serine protease Do
VPINLANSVVEQLLTTGRITRPFLGILPGDIEPELAAQFGLPVREGVIVLQVTPGSPAQRAGLRVQDIITRVNDTPITRGGDLRRALRELGPGAMVTISVLRPSGATTLRARLVEAPGAS